MAVNLPPDMMEMFQRLPGPAQRDVMALLATLDHLKQHPHDEVAWARVRRICLGFCRRYGPWVA